ncbi:MAG: (Fe-S)-binding protein [Deltaproteobacteria bacterium]|nr:(Fe-S)-binding protein [Deltaproteobacteria bacterium]
MRTLKQFTDEINKCVLCGTCRSVCPTFGVVNREPASARGKVALCGAFLNKEIGLSDGFIKQMNECVQCMACRTACPNDVNVPDIILAARAKIAKEKGLPFAKSFILKNILDSERLMPTAMKFASKLQGLLFKGVPEESGLHRRFSLPLIDERRLVPPLADRFFLEEQRARGKGEIASALPRNDITPNPELRTLNSKPRVGFFAGCLINYMLPNIGEASLKVLEKAGASVIIPYDQHCCGMPALGMGDVETAKSLVIKNLEAFEQYDMDYITTACATCGDGLKRRFKELLSDEGEDVRKRVERFAGKVRDITELLVNELRIQNSEFNRKSKIVNSKSEIVTYHDPCHLRRGQGIADVPREIIEISGAKLKEMSHPCRCCGLGGTFNITNYDFSMAINRDKAEDIKNTGADIVATACPGCIIQMKDGLHQLGADTKVVHVVELLASHLTSPLRGED